MARLTAAIRAEYPKAFETAGFLKGMNIRATPLARRMAATSARRSWCFGRLSASSC